MRRTTRVAVIASSVALCVAMLGIGDVPVAAHARTRSAMQPVAILTVFSGDVLLRPVGGGFSSAADGAVLYVGSTLRTSADARAVITLIEGSSVELEPASDITIEDATTWSGSTIVQLAQALGRSWRVVTHLTSADSRYELRTPAATASVRGIAFEVAASDGLASLTTALPTTEVRVAAGAATTAVFVTPAQTTALADAARQPSRSASVVERGGNVLARTPGARVRQENGLWVVISPLVHRGDRDDQARDGEERD
jgi:hypothetical protein